MEQVSSRTKVLGELTFQIVSALCHNNIECIYKKLLNSGLDKKSLGFWVWDIQNEKEIYSPKFRESLGYKDENDFPNVPESWMNAIHPSDLAFATAQFNDHIQSKGASTYEVLARYHKKEGEVIRLLCHGKIVSWDDSKPLIMIGFHLYENGLLKE